MENFKDYIKNKTGAATTKEEMAKLKAEYMRAVSGATVPAAERRRLEESMKTQISGAAVTENERKRLDNIIPKKAKGGMTKKQLDIAEAVAENPLFPGGTLIQLRQAAKAVKKAKGGEVVIGKGGDYIKDLL
jgi:hypothetical protein